MNYNVNNNKNQLENETNNNFCETNNNFLFIPCSLKGFNNTNTILKTDSLGKQIYYFYGNITLSDEEIICDCCGCKMHINDKREVDLKHIPLGEAYSYICIDRVQLFCKHCKFTKYQEIPFKEENHFITNQAKNYTIDLLATNKFTLKDVAYLTGLNKNLVKEIDKERLIKQYTVNGEGKKLIKPEEQANYLAIDEFKLHDGYKYASHIINLENGHILWIAEGKKKKVVYDFINHVGLSWMNHVKAIACDMNSDFEEAFKDMCPHIKVVYDYFHIVKNLNEKVISEIRKDEQRRLENAGDKEAARRLKRTRFILTSNRETLERKDDEANKKKVVSKGNELFKKDDVIRKGGNVDRYNQLINENELFLIIELIKELLQLAYKSSNEKEMAEYIFEIMNLCETNGNKHLLWFRNLLYNHFDGIITHATYKISTGPIEGINNKIKTIRRQSYGLPDDEYFFLKLLDMSRH